MTTARHVHLIGATGLMRTAKFRGQDRVVVPVTALVEGVIFPINADNPELVLASEFASAYQGWNGRPIVPNHPAENGLQISANSPRVLESQSIGEIFNARIKNNKLTMEAWLDPERCEKQGTHGQRVLARARAGEPIEVSVGAFVTAEDKKGVYNGKAYKAVWRDIVPDHLAMLPEGTIGACSIAMGCGMRAAQVHEIVDDEIRVAAFNEDQPRDEHGRWTDGGTSDEAAGGSHRVRDTAPDWTSAGALYSKVRSDGDNYLVPVRTTTKSNGGGRHELIVKVPRSVVNERAPKHPGSAPRTIAAWVAEDHLVSEPHPAISIVHQKKLKDAEGQLRAAYSDAQPRDEHGRWTDGGSSITPGSDRAKAADLARPINSRAGIHAIIGFSPERRQKLIQDADDQTLKGIVKRLNEHINEKQGLFTRKDGARQHAASPYHNARESVMQELRRRGVKADLSDYRKTPRTMERRSLFERLKALLPHVERAAAVNYDPGDEDDEDDDLDSLSDDALRAAGDSELIQRMHDESVKMGAKCTEYRSTENKDDDEYRTAQLRAAGGCGCGGGGGDKNKRKKEEDPEEVADPETDSGDESDADQETKMKTKKDRIAALIASPKTCFTQDDAAMLEGASDARLTAMEAHVEQLVNEDKTNAAGVQTLTERLTAAEAKATTLETAQAELKAAASKELTREEWLAKAPAEIRSLVAAAEAAEKAERDALITSLRAAQDAYTEDELKALSTADLRRTAKIAKVDGPKPVDFSGRLAPRVAESNDEIPAAPDLNARIRAAAGK